MKNNRITVPVIMPAELRPEEFATYFSSLAARAGPGANDLESIFQDYPRSKLHSADPSSRPDCKGVLQCPA